MTGCRRKGEFVPRRNAGNFTFLILGQVSSLIGNFTLKFALSMYVLERTGSASIFAGLLAAAMLPTILLSPFGGILADRANRRNIMVALDTFSGLAVFIAGLCAPDAFRGQHPKGECGCQSGGLHSFPGDPFSGKPFLYSVWNTPGLLCGDGLFLVLLAGKLRMRWLAGVLFAFGLCLVPCGLAFLLPLGTFGKYLILLAMFCVCQLGCSLFSTFAISVIQERTPEHLMGKVMSYVFTIAMCAQPLGQLVYGKLFDRFADSPYWVLIPSGVVVCLIGFLSFRFFRKIEEIPLVQKTDRLCMPH